MKDNACETSNQSGPGRSPRAIAAALFRTYGILMIFIGMCLIASLLSDSFLTTTNLINIVRQISVIGLIALGVTGVIVTAGIDLSSGSVMGLACVVAAAFAQNASGGLVLYPSLAGSSVLVAVLAGCFVGMAAGGINGLLVAKIKIPPFIATLGMFSAARGAAMLFTEGRPVSNLSDHYNYLGQGDLAGLPIPILILVVMALVTHVLYSRTKFGKYIYAIGGNEQAAHVSGVNVTAYKFLIYVYAGFLSALGGIVISARIGSGPPGQGEGYEFSAITAAVIGGASLSAGGIGTIPGTIIGALIIGVLNNTLDLTNVSAYWQQIIKGAIIVGAVILDQQKNKGRK